MAVTDKTFNISGGDQVLQTFSTNTELTSMFTHLIVRGVDAFPLVVKFSQGNINNDIDNDTNKIIGDDLLVPVEDCEGNLIIENIIANGNYVVAVDTFYGKWGDVRIEVGAATTGTVRIITNTIKKV